MVREPGAGHSSVDILNQPHGIRAGGGMKEQRKGDKTTRVVKAIVGFKFGAVFRADAAVVLIPIQAIVNWAQTKSGKPSSQYNPTGRSTRMRR